MTAPSLLLPWMAFSRDAGAQEAACLVFARAEAEAQTTALPVLQSWFEDVELEGVAVRMVTVDSMVSWHLYAQADATLLVAGVAHVIESPEVCSVCEQWGGRLHDGVCENCG